MVILSTPRVRRVCGNSIDLSFRLPSNLQRKWGRRAGHNYEEVCEIYLKMAQNCIWWRHVIRRSPDKKKRKHAKQCFLRDYPIMMAMTQIGMDDHLPWGTCQKLDRLFYNLNTR